MPIDTLLRLLLIKFNLHAIAFDINWLHFECIARFVHLELMLFYTLYYSHWESKSGKQIEKFNQREGFFRICVLETSKSLEHFRIWKKNNNLPCFCWIYDNLALGTYNFLRKFHSEEYFCSRHFWGIFSGHEINNSFPLKTIYNNSSFLQCILIIFTLLSPNSPRSPPFPTCILYTLIVSVNP